MSNPLKLVSHGMFRQICSDFLKDTNPANAGARLVTVEEVENGVKCMNIAYINREGWTAREELEGKILWEMCSNRMFEIEKAHSVKGNQ